MNRQYLSAAAVALGITLSVLLRTLTTARSGLTLTTSGGTRFLPWNRTVFWAMLLVTLLATCCIYLYIRRHR